LILSEYLSNGARVAEVIIPRGTSCWIWRYLKAEMKSIVFVAIKSSSWEVIRIVSRIRESIDVEFQMQEIKYALFSGSLRHRGQR